MALAIFQGTVVDRQGNVVPNANIRVYREAAGLPTASIFEDEDGVDPKGNPFQTDADGIFSFYARGYQPGYRIRAYIPGFERIWYNVRIGNAGGVDIDQLGIGSNTDRQVNNIAGRAAYDAEAVGFRVLVSDIGDGRAAIYERVGASGSWTDPAIVTGAAGPAGTGLAAEAYVNELADRDAYDASPEGFTVLVADVGDGRSAIYARIGASGNWTDPAYISASITVGTTTTGAWDDDAEVTQSGTPMARVLNFLIPRGQSAYLLAVAEGFVGDEAAWIASLEGTSAYGVAVENGFVGDEAAWLNSLKGVTAGLRYAFDTPTTDADPGAGKLRLNNAAPASATVMYLSTTDADGGNLATEIDSWDDISPTLKGTLLIRSAQAPSKYAFYRVSGSIVSATGYRKLTLVFISSAGGGFSAAEPLGLQFVQAAAGGGGISSLGEFYRLMSITN